MNTNRQTRTKRPLTIILAATAFVGWLDVARGQDTEMPQPSSQATAEEDARVGSIAEAEAALQRTQQAAAQAQAQITDAEQRLAALHRQAEDAQSAAAAAEKQLHESEAQLAQVAEQRVATEQQVSQLTQQLPGAQNAADAMQKWLSDAVAQLDQLTQQIADAGQQLSAVTAQIERGKQDTLDVEARLTEARAREEQSAAAVRVETMVRRGDALLLQGDISAARLFYDHAAAAGSGHAATAMGKTFDPAFLTRIGVVGLSADSSAAGTWYRRGIELGDDEARIRLQVLSFTPASHAKPVLARRQ